MLGVVGSRAHGTLGVFDLRQCMRPVAEAYPNTPEVLCCRPREVRKASRIGEPCATG